MKRHTPEEVSEKLRQAAVLANQGRSQNEICKALGVSVMTFHRWRKSVGSTALMGRLPAADPAKYQAEAAEMEGVPERSFIQELQSENRRLRRIVADLLLEKSKIEEALEKRGAKFNR